MKYAIVESGGKQFRAVEGGFIEVDKLPVEVGKVLTLESVLMTVDDDDKVAVGAPLVKGATVTATVEGHIKGDKITVFRYRPKKRIRVKTGHRQQYTRLKIDKIKVE
ncbi:MAG: 50S ribosomal protein L21 [Anaerolineae bacterium]|nr:50S ribosomal protein L21 [Anaerolineae bacterium]